LTPGLPSRDVIRASRAVSADECRAAATAVAEL
jgi:hypothetical protein